MSEQEVFIVGIKGVAMANLAVILKKMGKNVAGCDVDEEFITDEVLTKNNIKVFKGFTDPLPPGTELVIYTGAHGGRDNPQVSEALQRKIPVISQAEFLGRLFSEFKTKIAVCGSHGKTTTTALIAYALHGLEKSPSYLVGSPSFNEFEGGNFEGRDYFVLEADEYAVDPPHDKTPKFLMLAPDYILATNVDFDHPDVFSSIEEVKKAFALFFDKGKKIIACGDDKNIRAILEKYPRENYVLYGRSRSNDYILSEVRTEEFGMGFALTNGQNSSVFELSLYGEKNALNAAGAICLLTVLGFQVKDIADAVKGFRGAKRRFERVAYLNGIHILDDYAHHPEEIEATIRAASNLFNGQRIIVIFQPHTYSRTNALLKEFARALSLADVGIVAPIFASARENPSDFKITSEDIAKAAGPEGKLLSCQSLAEVSLKLASVLRRGDVVFTMGAGNIYTLKDGIIEVIKNLSEGSVPKSESF